MAAHALPDAYPTSPRHCYREAARAGQCRDIGCACGGPSERRGAPSCAPRGGTAPVAPSQQLLAYHAQGGVLQDCTLPQRGASHHCGLAAHCRRVLQDNAVDLHDPVLECVGAQQRRAVDADVIADRHEIHLVHHVNGVDEGAPADLRAQHSHVDAHKRCSLHQQEDGEGDARQCQVEADHVDAEGVEEVAAWPQPATGRDPLHQRDEEDCEQHAEHSPRPDPNPKSNVVREILRVGQHRDPPDPENRDVCLLCHLLDAVFQPGHLLICALCHQDLGAEGEAEQEEGNRQPGDLRPHEVKHQPPQKDRDARAVREAILAATGLLLPAGQPYGRDPQPARPCRQVLGRRRHDPDQHVLLHHAAGLDDREVPNEAALAKHGPLELAHSPPHPHTSYAATVGKEGAAANDEQVGAVAKGEGADLGLEANAAAQEAHEDGVEGRHARQGQPRAAVAHQVLHEPEAQILQRSDREAARPEAANKQPLKGDD
mmetsp:Transcript_35183/g.95391  ORF Transcript_35183/g.95391 Transcript_35183/m.95391 type:complete len:486 (-) Transcript_35183:1301-2758(-)